MFNFYSYMVTNENDLTIYKQFNIFFIYHIVIYLFQYGLTMMIRTLK